MSSLCEPASTILPSAHARMMSQFSIVLRRCAMVKEVRSTSTLFRACCTSCSDAESRAEVASSRSMICGSRTIARQIATRCFWPPERRSPRGPTCVSQPSCSFRKLRHAMVLHFSRCSSETLLLSMP
mmetsp:Transcript_36924/g.95318  ORF Transcript_36924/g.95318 Transcript_36924/m.95318 type:complete len:127 (+) Transcript_36924:389-769(+)